MLWYVQLNNLPSCDWARNHPSYKAWDHYLESPKEAVHWALARAQSLGWKVVKVNTPGTEDIPVEVAS
jgi:hypothetical protein